MECVRCHKKMNTATAEMNAYHYGSNYYACEHCGMLYKAYRPETVAFDPISQTFLEEDDWGKEVVSDEQYYTEKNISEMKTLAIKGDKEQGDEVIALLEMMGGISKYSSINGYNDTVYYYLTKNSTIAVDDVIDDKFAIFTLDEFYKKYPYKVGDVVKTGTDEEGIIKQIKWVDNDIVYWVESNKTCKWAQTLSVDVLDKYNRLKSNDIEHIWATTVETNKRDRDDVLFDSIIWHLRNSVNNGKQHLSGGDCEAYFRELVKKVKMYKPVYPKTYEECREILDEQADVTYGYSRDILHNLQVLLVCRDAYWKIAGEEMELGKPWEPKSIEMSHAIVCRDDGDFLLHRVTKAILIFPTEEMRDAFYENFKDLIEQCKELL